MNEESQLILIPKCQDYIEYMIEVIIKMPRTEKFNIGNEYKQSMYKMLNSVLYINKIDASKRLYYINQIDADLDFQRVLLRIMHKNRWIDTKKFDVAMEKVSQIGKILGGLIKYYGKNIKKRI